MNGNDTELMERYIYQVVKRLPKNQRSEVALELRELIGDMAVADESMEKALTRLGDPAEFAKKYQDTERHLIGPEYYDDYLWFLKVVLICAGIAVLIVSIIEGVTGALGAAFTGAAGMCGINAAAAGVINSITSGIGNLTVACVSVFGGVTLLFAMMERNKVRFDRKKKGWSVDDLAGDRFVKGMNWTPKQLTPVPHEKALISRGDSIVGIIFIVIFSTLLIFAPWVFGAILQVDGELMMIPVFNLDQWHVILPIFIFSLGIGLADEIFRLVSGYYCRAVMISNIICGTVQIILSAILLKVFPILNPDFASDILLYFEKERGAVEWLAVHWNSAVVADGLLTLVIFATLLEIGTTVYKTLRYA